MPRRRPLCQQQWVSQHRRKRNGSLATAFNRSFPNDDSGREQPEYCSVEDKQEEVDERTPMLGPRLRLMNGALARTDLRTHDQLR